VLEHLRPEQMVNGLVVSGAGDLDPEGHTANQGRLRPAAAVTAATASPVGSDWPPADGSALPCLRLPVHLKTNERLET
jgi:hypothetical protein